MGRRYLADIAIGLLVSAGSIAGGYGLRVWWNCFLWLAEVL